MILPRLGTVIGGVIGGSLGPLIGQLGAAVTGKAGRSLTTSSSITEARAFDRIIDL